MKVPLQFLKTLSAIFALATASVCSLKGATMHWGTLPNDVLLDSAGNALTADFVFELGTFAGGFVPTDSNVFEWEANWMVFDAAVVGTGWNPAGQEVVRSANHTAGGGSDSIFADPGDVFDQGAVAYLWVYNTKDLSGTLPEWALLEDVDNGPNLFASWEFPDPSEQSGESYDLQTRDLDSPILGGVNSVRGAGLFALEPPVFTIQTAVVPEPGAGLLLAVGALWTLRRHRRMAAVG
jgi:hypothetical protein